MRSFTLILGLIIVGFSLIFREFGEGSEENYGTSLLNSYNLLYGPPDDEGDFFSLPFLFSLTCFIVSVILLNMLIAIMGDSFEKVQEKRALTDSKEKVEMLYETIILKRYLHNLFSRGRRSKDSEDDDSRKKCIIFCEETLASEDSTSKDEWEGRINLIKKTIRNINRESQLAIEKKVASIEKSMEKSVEAKLARVEAKVAGIEKSVEAKVANVEKKIDNIMEVLQKLLPKA